MEDSTTVSAIAKNNLNVADAPEGFSPHHKLLIILLGLTHFTKLASCEYQAY
ncbi:hypothetical protein GXM_06115 [Nostoc sphaeroides CCNUC1]|uniref:Uncharacterized protein n=1 Tax=Nostoc sphaeroides CCNUC1 TaxID=2653204 RepID=A0A5P8W7V6_9NOSO|nr:hypothetical protein GXM_06115 [Nostoc sphaeroides CCNUC1]